MKSLLKKYFWYIACISLSIFLIFSSDSRKSSYQSFEDSFLEKFTPLLSIANSAAKLFTTIGDSISLFINQKKKLEELYEKNAFLEHYYYLYKLTLAENDALKEELKYTQKYHYQFVTGKIIAKNNSSINQEALIDLGVDNSIEKGQWVLYRNQLFGRIIEVHKNYSRILLVSAPLSRIPAMSVNSKEKFIVAGLALDHFACLHLRERSDLKEDELVVTSNLDIGIPEGVIIGAVIKENDVFYVKPNFNPNKAEYIQVLKYEIRK